MLGTRTWGGMMVGADESTELWRHPNILNSLSCRTYLRESEDHARFAKISSVTRLGFKKFGHLQQFFAQVGSGVLPNTKQSLTKLVKLLEVLPKW